MITGNNSHFQNVTKLSPKIPDILQEAIDISTLVKMELPKRPLVISPFLRMPSISMVYSDRGLGKTWFGLSLGFSITTMTPIGNWDVVAPVGVLYVDGEMACDEMQNRIRDLSAALPPRVAPFKLLSSDWLHQKGFSSINLSDDGWRKRFSDALTRSNEFGVLILDNLSCLMPGIEENNKEAWDPINRWLIDLRFSGVAVIFLHHAGKGGHQRGTSGREDALDNIIKLSKPAGYNPAQGANFIVSFEKARGSYGSGISDFNFSLGQDEDGNMIWLTDVPDTGSKKEKIIALLGSGKSPQEIMSLVKTCKQNVSNHKKRAIEKGYLFKDPNTGIIRFTPEGRGKYIQHLIDL